METPVVAHPLKKELQFRYSDLSLNFEFVCFRNKHQAIQTEYVCLH